MWIGPPIIALFITETVSDETVYRLSVYRLIGSVYRYRTDLEPIPNLNSVLKKKIYYYYNFFFLGTDFSFGIGSKSVDTDFPLIFGSIAMLYSQVQATHCIRFHINASLIPIPIPISYRIHTDFNTDTDTSVFRPENTDTDTEFKIPYRFITSV